MKQNLGFAFVYNALGVPLGCWRSLSTTGWLLSPMIAALAMSLSSVSVITNAGLPHSRDKVGEVALIAVDILCTCTMGGIGVTLARRRWKNHPAHCGNYPRAGCDT